MLPHRQPVPDRVAHIGPVEGVLAEVAYQVVFVLVVRPTQAHQAGGEAEPRILHTTEGQRRPEPAQFLIPRVLIEALVQLVPACDDDIFH